LIIYQAIIENNGASRELYFIITHEYLAKIISNRGFKEKLRDQ
jgi:hypothetical protein